MKSHTVCVEKPLQIPICYYENLFHLQVNFHANQTHFYMKRFVQTHFETGKPEVGNGPLQLSLTQLAFKNLVFELYLPSTPSGIFSDFL